MNLLLKLFCLSLFGYSVYMYFTTRHNDEKMARVYIGLAVLAFFLAYTFFFAVGVS